MYLLDTDTIIYALKGHRTVKKNLQFFADTPKAFSVISYGELVFGAHKSQRVQENLAKIHHIKEIFPVIDLTPAIMVTFGELKANIEAKGTCVADFDLLIGATALCMDYTIVTNNTKHFSKIPCLKFTNWSV